MRNSISQIDHRRRIKATSFDGDMTLWDFEAVMRHSLRHALAELHKCLPGNNLVELMIDRMIEIRDAVAAGLEGQSLSLEQIRLEAFVRTLSIASGASMARVTAAGSRCRPGELCGVMGPERLVPIGQVSGTVWRCGRLDRVALDVI
jgi:hypothetical protein